MQRKNLQTLLARTIAQQASPQEAELLSQELAAQLKSGAGHPPEDDLAPWPLARGAGLATWLYRLQAALTRLSHSE